MQLWDKVRFLFLGKEKNFNKGPNYEFGLLSEIE